jgi:hypothetical protein
MPIQARCQIGIQDCDGHRAVTTVFLVGNMSLTKIHAESMVVGHPSTVTMAGHNLFDVFKYDCLVPAPEYSVNGSRLVICVSHSMVIGKKFSVNIYFSDAFGNGKPTNSSVLVTYITNGIDIAFVRELGSVAIFDITPRSLAANCSVNALIGGFNILGSPIIFSVYSEIGAVDPSRFQIVLGTVREPREPSDFAPAFFSISIYPKDSHDVPLDDYSEILPLLRTIVTSKSSSASFIPNTEMAQLHLLFC